MEIAKLNWKCYYQGYRHGRGNKKFCHLENPYEYQSLEWHYWNQGYNEGVRLA